MTWCRQQCSAAGLVLKSDSRFGKHSSTQILVCPEGLHDLALFELITAKSKQCVGHNGDLNGLLQPHDASLNVSSLWVMSALEATFFSSSRCHPTHLELINLLHVCYLSRSGSLMLSEVTSVHDVGTQ